MKECRNCHQLLDESCFNSNPRNKDGLHSYCKKCVAEKAKIYNNTKGKEKMHVIQLKQKGSGYFVFGRGAYINKKNSASKRGISFDITEEEYTKWYKKTDDICHYCGCTLEEYIKQRDFIVNYGGKNDTILKIRQSVFNTENSKKISVMTVDRKDSSNGYNLGNIVKSCWICNSLKSNKMSEKEASVYMKKIKAIINEEIKINGK